MEISFDAIGACAGQKVSKGRSCHHVVNEPPRLRGKRGEYGAGRGCDHYRSFARLPNVRAAYLCDIDERLFPGAVAEVESLGGNRPGTFINVRKAGFGPPYRALTLNRFHYGWRYFWDTSTSGAGNNGVPAMDLVRLAGRS